LRDFLFFGRKIIQDIKIILILRSL
jgi:hypothetical protein